MLEAHLLDRLEQLYAELPSLMHRPEVNACGACRKCCTATGLSRQNVTDLEVALLERHYGAERARAFASYAQRERGTSGEYLYAECPNLKEEGCSVYSHRPYSCRVFGHYRASATRLPDACVYIGQEREFLPEDYYRTVPGAVRLRQLSRDYQLRRPAQVGPEAEAGPGGSIGLNLEDEFDRALDLVGRGQIAEAESCLPPAGPEESLFGHYVRALVAGEQNRHELALTHYARVLGHCPQRYDLMTFAGLHAFQLGRLEQAEKYWTEAALGQPEVALTQAFLGYLALQRGQWSQAAERFGRAAELEPEQPLHQERRRQALAMLTAD